MGGKVAPAPLLESENGPVVTPYPEERDVDDGGTSRLPCARGGDSRRVSSEHDILAGLALNNSSGHGQRVTIIHQRRRSIDEYVQHAKLGTTGQISFRKLETGGYDLVDTGEVVATGCCAKETGDALISVMLGEATVKYTGKNNKRRGMVILLVPPLVAGLVYGMIPLKCPGLGVFDSGFAAISFLPPAVAAPGLGHLMLKALGVVPNYR